MSTLELIYRIAYFQLKTLFPIFVFFKNKKIIDAALYFNNP